LAVFPEAASAVAVFEPYAVDVPYSTNQVVGSPFGFTVPPSVAVVGPTEVAGDVTTTGGDAVVNSPSPPLDVPDEFFATRR
jgi:hypothetical protein